MNLKRFPSGLCGILILLVAFLVAMPLPVSAASNADALAEVQHDVTSGFGVNIHFVYPKAGELEMIHAAGLHIVRIDFDWKSIEKQKGKYDFTAYDQLLKKLEANHLRAMFILDYGNPLYEDGQPPRTAESRHAFATWAAASVNHFSGHQIIWETWNEPDWQFWKPKPDADEYAQLALETAKAIHIHTPDETCIGPAVSRYDTDCKFIQTCLAHGCLDEWTAISVHPYRDGKPPETVVTYYDKLRATVATGAPGKPGKPCTIIAGEWGYTNTDVKEPKQGAFAAREFLVNIASGIPVSIWYDWEDDGTDPKNGEYRFGLVRHGYHADKKPVFDPKPAFLALQACSTALYKSHFVARLDTPKQDWILEFDSPQKHVYAIWTTAGSHPADILLPTDTYQQCSMEGTRLEDIKSVGGHASVQFSSEPHYYSFAK